MNRFLIINPFGIGDVLFTTPVIRAIKENYPASFIAYWCNQRTRDILKNNKDIDRVFALSRGDLKKIYGQSRFKGIYIFLKLLYQIKKERFDASFDFSLDHRYSLISKLLGIPRRLGFNYKRRGRFLTHKIDIEGYISKHVVEYYLDLLRFINIETKNKDLCLTVSEASKVKINSIFKNFGINNNDLVIGIAAGAGASWGKDAVLKHWPAIRFVHLADRLSNELGAKIIVLSDESERPISDTIVKMMKNKPIDLGGKTNLEDFAAAIERLNILITNDGGPLHIAVALGIKTVSIFGPVDDTVYGPYPATSNHIVVRKEMSCRPCYKNFRIPICNKERECIDSISTDEVFGAVRRLLL